MRIELTLAPWKGAVLPLYESRLRQPNSFIIYLDFAYSANKNYNQYAQMTPGLKRLLKKRRFWLTLIFIAAVLIGLYLFLSRPVNLPAEFIAARGAAASASEKIVALSTATNEKIKEVNLSDLSGDPLKAQLLIQEARVKNTDAYGEAFRLSKYLQQMTESLTNISSFRIQRLAYEAIAVELVLVNEFINYTENLNEFLNNLAKAVASDAFSDRRAVQERMEAVNSNVLRINDLNQIFLAKIGEFDKSF